MAIKVWEELGDGRMKLTLSPEGGGPASVYYGKDKDEILDKLADSQVNANVRIAQLRPAPNGSAAAAPPPTEPKPLTANERMQAVADLNNPATVDKAVGRVMESVIGPIEDFQRDREAQKAERIARMQVAAAELFADSTPEWHQSEHNCEMVANYIVAHGGDLTNVEHYQQAFARLSAAKLLETKPAKTEPPDVPPTELHERNAPNLSAPRAQAGYSTGVRSSDISGTAPNPVKRLKYSREQIDNMSPAEYKRNMSDPEFQRAVEFYSRPQRRASA
jgi:hypothetical protein